MFVIVCKSDPAHYGHITDTRVHTDPPPGSCHEPLCLTSAGAHHGDAALGGLGGGELPGDGGDGGLEPGEHPDAGPENGEVICYGRHGVWDWEAA